VLGRRTRAGHGTVCERRVAPRSRRRRDRFIARVMRGDALQAVGVDKHGRPSLPARASGPLHAAKLLIEHGYGKAPREAELEDEQPPLTREEMVAPTS